MEPVRDGSKTGPAFWQVLILDPFGTVPKRFHDGPVYADDVHGK